MELPLLAYQMANTLSATLVKSPQTAEYQIKMFIQGLAAVGLSNEEISFCLGHAAAEYEERTESTDMEDYFFDGLGRIEELVHA